MVHTRVRASRQNEAARRAGSFEMMEVCSFVIEEALCPSRSRARAYGTGPAMRERMKTTNRVVGFGAFLVAVGIAPEARADLDACGGVYLEAEAAAKCEVIPTETCTPKCTEVAGEKVCAARLTTTCNGGCTASAELACVSTCSETCVPSCTTTETDSPPNCNGLCMSDCQQDCTAKCADAPNKGECRSSCAQCCSNNCKDQCSSKEETTCAPVCSLACAGSCVAKANIDCQVTCQSDLFTTCKETVVEECKDECTTTGAAIFCDGQFLATAGDLEGCADDLKAEFDIDLDISVAVKAECEDDSCEATVKAKVEESNSPVNCSTSMNQATTRSGLSWLGFLALSVFGIRRSRRGL